MQTLSATPTEIGKLFNDSYCIPEYQRPYSWDEDECQQLWDDIESFFSSRGTNENYFCGSLVFFNEEKSGKTVIDGQQRLTTFMLFLKALLEKAGTHSRLENCVRIKDDVTGKLTKDLRIKSNVFADDKKNLSAIVIDGVLNSDPKKYNRFEKNYTIFTQAIDKWRINKTTQEFNDFIKGILDNVVLLPIECSSQDDALTIFNTVNNRGMSLCDADIFKAILYKAISDKDKFLVEWDDFKRKDVKENYDWIFNIYMHILMSEDGTLIDTRERINKRKYFDKKKILQKDPTVSMESLKKINAIWGVKISDNSFALWNIMREYPNDLWYYPIYVFLYKYGSLDNSGNYELHSDKTSEFESLMESMAKYCLIKGVVHNTSNAIKHTIYKICKEIAFGGDYNILFDITSDDRIEFERKIKANNLARFSRCLILLSAFLNPKQDKSKYLNLFSKKWDIEHILPRKGWNNYDGWTEPEYKDVLGNIGNLVPFDRVLNINAQNSFFIKKQEEYKKEKEIQDIIDLMTIPQWKPAELNARNDDKIKLILAYFL